MKKSTTLTAILAIASLSTMTLLAMPPGSRGGPDAPGEEFGGRSPPPPLPPAEQLAKAGATEDQINVLMDFQYEQDMKRIDLHAAVDKAQSTLDHLLHAATANEKAVMEAVDTLNRARGEMFKSEIAGILKMNQILGEDTLRKLREQAPPRGPENNRCGRGPGVFKPAENVDAQQPEPEHGE